MRELVILRDQHCVFPWCHTDTRACDLDHIIEYLPITRGGPPGQTHPDNLAALLQTPPPRQDQTPPPRQDQTPPPRQDQTPMALPTRTRRHLHLDRTPRHCQATADGTTALD
jgi:hypothetical protein